MRIAILPLILPLVLLAAPVQAQAPPATATPTAAPETRTCLPLPQIQSSNVVNDRTIDLRLRDGSVWRNRLPASCPGLGIERAFSYSTGISQLCNVDIIRVVVQSGVGIQGASCGLGLFERQPAAPARTRH